LHSNISLSLSLGEKVRERERESARECMKAFSSEQSREHVGYDNVRKKTLKAFAGIIKLFTVVIITALLQASVFVTGKTSILV